MADSRHGDAFKRYYFLIYILVGVMRITPKFLLKAIWPVLDISDGRIGMGVRYAIARRLAKQVGVNVMFGRSVYVRGWDSLIIGDNVSIHPMCYLDASGGLFIGNDVSIAHGVSVITFNHTWADYSKPIKYNISTMKEIVIDNDVWIGCGARILAGVKIGQRSVVAAGAVVTKEMPAGTLIGGVPAKPMKNF